MSDSWIASIAWDVRILGLPTAQDVAIVRILGPLPYGVTLRDLPIAELVSQSETC
jgi:hypothetical protein